MLEKQPNINLFHDAEEMHKNHLSYWIKKLTGAPPLLELAADKPRSSVVFRRFSNYSFLIPKLAGDQLRDIGQRSDADLFSTLLASFKTLLYRYTNQEDILVGYSDIDVITAVNEAGKLVSGQMNNMVFRTDLSGDPGFADLLKRVHSSVREAKEHQSLPFDILVQSLRTENVHVDSLFQIAFEFYNADHSEIISNFLTGPAVIQSPELYLSIEETHEGLSGRFNYNPDLFTENTVKRIAIHFQNLLAGIVTNPDQPITRLPLLSESERLQILFEWNNTAVEYPHDKCIHELFEEQVMRTPGAVAAEFYEPEGSNSISAPKALTYHQLNTKANQLAYYLRELGVGPDILVGVCITRSHEMMVGLMAVLKAGGAYVPLDPGYPQERLQFMLKDAGVSVLLTQQPLKEKLLSDNTINRVVCLDSDWDKISMYSNKNLVSTAKPGNLAYVIYTSGSTGLPKGTLIIHRGVVNYLSWCIKNYAVSVGSGAPVNSSIAFDATVTSFFAPLLVGKRIMLLPEAEEIEALSAVLLSGNNFSLVKITPAHLEILRHTLPADQIKNQVNALVIGGEALLAKSLDLWRKNAPNTRLINEYGPTETVVGCCTFEVTDKMLSEDVPIGRPIANTQMYILDRNMEPVPIGVSGEIYIGGAGLARGYLHRPDLTEQRFVPNPFSDDPNIKLYKTGDLARYLSDGNIVFQGRIDQQVKIRGYRIELGEIEAALGNHPDILQVAILAREDKPGDKRLVAYLVLRHQDAPTTNDLRKFLSKKLPEYMIPAVFVFLKTLPLTANGKVDRAALPVPDQSSSDFEKSYIAPRNATELTLTKIFEKCMNISSISVDDDFFELGGSSIQAAIAFSQIRKAFGKPLPLAILIQAPTIEKIAAYLNGQLPEQRWSSLVPIQPNGNKPPLFCIHGGWGNVLFYRHLSKRLGQDQPVYGLQAKGLNGVDTPYEKLEDMAAHYIREIRTVQPQGPYYLAGYCFGAIAAFEMAQQLQREGQKIAFLGSFNGISPTEPQSVKASFRFSNLSGKDKLLYPLRKLKYFLKRNILLAYYNTLVKARSAAYKFYLGTGRRMPDNLGRHYVLDALTRAQNAYDPHVYPGNLIIFRSPKIFKNPHLGWSNLVGGKIKTHDMPGDYKIRKYIMFEPYVQFLAEELKKYLGTRRQETS